MGKACNRDPLISVIVPVYNVEKYINKCVDSIINQTYKKTEIILVDDGSTDNCSLICDNYSKEDMRVKVIHQKNGGLSDARNKGVDIATGDYLVFVDSDDYVEKNYISFLVNLAITDNADIAVGAQYIKYPNNSINEGSGKKYILNSHDALQKLLYNDDLFVSSWSKLYKASLFKNVRFPKKRLYEDAATTYKLLDKASIISVHSIPIYNYVIRDNSITTCAFNAKKFDLIDSTLEMTAYVRKKYPDLEKACDSRIMYAYLNTLAQLAKANKGKTANYDYYKEKLMSYIREHRKYILADRAIPKRDRYALYCTYLGFDFFKLAWKLYYKIKTK